MQCKANVFIHNVSEKTGTLKYQADTAGKFDLGPLEFAL